PTKWQIRGTIGEMSHPIDVAVSPDEKYVYVANAYAHSGLEPDEVAVIDTATHTVIKRITVGNYPYRMATAGNMLYVTNYMDANVSMINMDTNEVLNTTFGVGTYPTGIAVTADGETIYVVNNGSQSVSIRIY
ncbi:MAG: YncE family protein, partial [Deltaproteobacteria bacterium]|nr:YncE family protein [Deltaproteobacteria bacterium]